MCAVELGVSRACVCEPVCERVGDGDGRWGAVGFFFELHFSNSFLLCSPKRRHTEWSKHLTFVKCWWSGPDGRGGTSGGTQVAAQSRVQVTSLSLSVRKRESGGGGRQRQGLPVPPSCGLPASDRVGWAARPGRSGDLPAENVLAGSGVSRRRPWGPRTRLPGRGWSQNQKAVAPTVGDGGNRQESRCVGPAEPCSVRSHGPRTVAHFLLTAPRERGAPVAPVYR